VRKLIMVILIVLFLWPSVAFATPIGDAIKDLEASGKQSNAYLNHSVVDLVYLSSQGSVTAYTYMGADENLTINSFSVLPQSPLEAHDKFTRFIWELRNRYYPATELTLSGTGSLPTVRTWTYGTMKDEAMWGIVYGLEDCLNSLPYDWQSKYDDDSSNDSSYIDKYSPETIATTLASIFTIGSTTYSITTATTGNETTSTIDVAPEIMNNRTFVPVRYVAYAVGVAKNGIKWDASAKKVTITKNETTVNFLIGQKWQYINGQHYPMDVFPYIKDGRTMLPARWVVEPFGGKVDWDEVNQQVKIEITEQGQ